MSDPAGEPTLDRWLDHIGSVHTAGIDLGLDRVGRVAERMGFAAPAHRPAPRSVIVAGTNGKGSTSVAIEALLRAAGLRVGTTLSPHVSVFNERVRIDGRMADDAMLCDAFARVEAARGDVPLTYFEFSALAALHCFRRAEVDVAVLEVGLGGRLDAFNLVDADVAVVTSIGLDHQAWLGDDREAIGREKAGVLRTGCRAVLGENVTDSVVEAAQRLGCRTTRLGPDFRIGYGSGHWHFASGGMRLEGLPLDGLAPENWALALEVAAHLEALPETCLSELMAATRLPGRLESRQISAGGRSRLLLLDVAHNPDGARFLREQLVRRHTDRRFVALLGMLADKDAAGVADALDGVVRGWVCVPTRGLRALAGETLAERIRGAVGPARCRAEPGLAKGLARALSWCGPEDGILTFGSFDVIAQMDEHLRLPEQR